VTNFLDARIVVRYPQLTVDAEVSAARGEIIGLVGPNGAGKSTVLRAIAGLQALDDGRITIAKTVVDDPANDVLVPPPHRRVGVVFQDYRLFPHLTALDNVAFGLRRRGMKRDTAREAAADWLKRLDVIDHAGHKPSTLSGGQAQRVALARALATVPDVLLLDEPFAAIDTEARGRIRDDLARYLSGFTGTTILVSHQPDDIGALTQRAIVLGRGVVVWQGPSEELQHLPSSTGS
jgi:molybdate transport system ATP-binding protein